MIPADETMYVPRSDSGGNAGIDRDRLGATEHHPASRADRAWPEGGSS